MRNAITVQANEREASRLNWRGFLVLQCEWRRHVQLAETVLRIVHLRPRVWRPVDLLVRVMQMPGEDAHHGIGRDCLFPLIRKFFAHVPGGPLRLWIIGIPVDRNRCSIEIPSHRIRIVDQRDVGHDDNHFPRLMRLIQQSAENLELLLLRGCVGLPAGVPILEGIRRKSDQTV